jgi:GntR family transcriptional regulator
VSSSDGLDLNYIDPRSPVALHYQLRQILRHQIESGVYKPGDPFPTSRELREKYRVSSTTVEHTLRWLAENGLIHRQRGRGTVVSRPPISEELPHLTGFIEEAEAQGWGFTPRVLRAEFVQPTELQVETLCLAPGEKAFRLDRLITIRDEPTNVELGCYPPAIGERFLAEPMLMNGRLYRTFETEFGLQLDKACQTIGATTASRREAELLNVSVGSPLVYLDRIVYLTDGRPVQHVRCYLPSSRYTLKVWLKRRSGGLSSGLSFNNSQTSNKVHDNWD